MSYKSAVPSKVSFPNENFEQKTQFLQALPAGIIRQLISTRPTDSYVDSILVRPETEALNVIRQIL